MTVATRSYLYTLVSLLAALTATGGCTNGNVVFGNIPPSTFQFGTVLSHEGPGPGGWQVAQIAVLLGRLSVAFARAAVCDVEVGMPLMNTRQGLITEEMAQIQSAIAADRAARKILGERKKPTATACDSFRTTMEFFLADPKVGTIDGARVSKFRVWRGKKVPRRTFPPRRGW